MDSMTVRFSHTCREGNGVADRLADLGAAVDSFTWWDFAPLRLLLFCTRMFLDCLAVGSASYFFFAGLFGTFLFYFNIMPSL